MKKVLKWIGIILLVLVVGVAFAFALQVAQLFVPRRDSALSDVLWNALGLLIGMALVAGGSRIHLPWLGRQSLRAPLAMARAPASVGWA